MDEGLELTLLPVDERGIVDPRSVREAIKENTVFVSIQMVNSEIGTIQNIREIAKEIRHIRKLRSSHGRSPERPVAEPVDVRGLSGELSVYFHTDASQAPLWISLNTEKIGVDLLTIDAQKIMGPKGVGALFARRGVEMTPLIYGGGQERGFRSGTENVAYAGALAVALVEAQDGVDTRAEKISRVRDSLFSEIIKVIPDATLNGPQLYKGEPFAPAAKGSPLLRVANNLNISISKLNGDMAVIALDAEGIAVSTRSACDTDDDTPSHVLAAIGLSGEAARNSIRITLLPDATMGDARLIAKKLSEVASRYRQ
jgi:cysteine desulfurase